MTAPPIFPARRSLLWLNVAFSFYVFRRLDPERTRIASQGPSLGLMAAIASALPRGRQGARGITLAGTLFFALQTAVLDALIWPAYFPVQGG